MCVPASLVITKDRVFWSKKSDSHEEIIREFGLLDEVANRITLARVEITPPAGDMREPLERWQFRLDEPNPDYVPDWYKKNPSKHEERARAALACWFTAKVLLSGNGEFKDQEVYLYGNSTATLYYNSTATLYGNSTATLYYNSTATLYGNSTAIGYGYKEVVLESGLSVLVDRSKYNTVTTKKAEKR